jgi:FtsH-binding integral membrane protein
VTNLDVYKTAAGLDITSVEDLPDVARLLERQQFLSKWYYCVGIAPFAVLIFVALKFFPDSNSRKLVTLVFASLVLGNWDRSLFLLFDFLCRLPCMR